MFLCGTIHDTPRSFQVSNIPKYHAGKRGSCPTHARQRNHWSTSKCMRPHEAIGNPVWQRRILVLAYSQCCSLRWDSHRMLHSSSRPYLLKSRNQTCDQTRGNGSVATSFPASSVGCKVLIANLALALRDRLCGTTMIRENINKLDCTIYIGAPLLLLLSLSFHYQRID